MSIFNRLSKEEKAKLEAKEKLEKKYEKNRKILERHQLFNNAYAGDKTRKIIPYDKSIVVNFNNMDRGSIYCYHDTYEGIISEMYDKIIKKDIGEVYFDKYVHLVGATEYNKKITIKYDTIVSISDEI